MAVPESSHSSPAATSTELCHGSTRSIVIPASRVSSGKLKEYLDREHPGQWSVQLKQDEFKVTIRGPSGHKKVSRQRNDTSIYMRRLNPYLTSSIVTAYQITMITVVWGKDDSFLDDHSKPRIPNVAG
ncbi:hypothetical protein F4778DRAFT_351044 [Xylariomycetidae sp. FL2044]|nr:hypothetical protein F4778DRAFT_351044 [Xylariomycetidae sp. FL2044]